MKEENSLKSVIQSFKYDSKAPSSPGNGNRIRKRVQKQPKVTHAYKDLAPSLSGDLKAIFVGFNPGIQSSLQQHHYAHFTNLFWKLFNQSDFLLKVLKSLGVDIEKEIECDELLRSVVIPGDITGSYRTAVKAEHDFEISKYHIGFTDLVLRCTRMAQELTLDEKLANVPRLISEFSNTGARYVVFVGKGIWEIVVKYYADNLGINFKLTKSNFLWGKQIQRDDSKYNLILSKLYQALGHPCSIYVFPSTSGLVTSLNYNEKLKLWHDLGDDVVNEANS
ncbi:Piso0_002260 [Millerozyma farinosa CBS 7064]|uniref:Piso0_002260 protein n=1 Tax=Pichia sorbitophila (strain ATCC MYA-4447 / BCRC 22081 / CBS 7064 / NBRC 10061 / NRRL Y-12695) TaxID=559304 RepID=G8YC49_PICSO|nr:Piso0_002260 [Millerozyma farinosa CBS 7064]